MMKMKFWGTRGSCAAPYADRSEFGGNTSCTSLRNGNCWLIMDAGTGIIPLAAEIREAALSPDADPCCVKILISHYHLDHVIGLPMFLAALPKTVEVTLYTAVDGDWDNEAPYAESIVSLIGPPLWPVRLTDVCGQLRFADLRHSTDHDLGEGIIARAVPSNHPNNASMFRIRWNGIDLVYGLDCEISDDYLDTYIDFCRDCDVLLFDGAYTDADYPRCVGFGHSPISKVIPVTEKSGAKRVYVMHYEYKYTDDLLRKAEEELDDCGKRICFAREGQVVELMP